MKIVIDSNIIIADFWLESAKFKILFESSKNDEIEIYIPEVVIDEVINKYTQKVNGAKTTIEAEYRKFNKLSKRGLDSNITPNIIDDTISNYKDHLEKVINDYNINIIPYPKVNHKFIAQKAMKKLKPFNTNEKGYRDALIWENIKSLLTEEGLVLPELTFITTNHKDFSNSGELHPDLITELQQEGFSEDSVKIYSTLNEFNEKKIKLFLAQSSSFEKKLKDGEIWDFDLLDVTNKYLFANFVDSQLYNLDFLDDSNEPTVRAIYDDYDIEIISVKKLNSTEYIVDLKFEVETEIDFFIDKNEYYHLYEDIDISIEDANWNRYVMWVSTTSIIPLSMTIILNIDLEVISSQINEINENYT